MTYRKQFVKGVFYPTDRVRVTGAGRSFTGVVLSANETHAVVEPDDGGQLMRCSVGFLEHIHPTDERN